MAIGWFTQPRDLSVQVPHADEKTERPAYYERNVTCNANCQVRFGVSDESKPNGADQDAEAGENAANEIARADFAEQQRMAHWSVVIAFLTGYGALLLIGTLIEAFKGSEAAKIAADAANTQAQAAINAGRAFFQPIEPFIQPNNPARRDEVLDNVMGFHARVHNRGLGPGFLWRFALGHEIVPDGQEPRGDNVRVGDYLGRTPIEKDADWGVDEDTALLTFKLTDENINDLLDTSGRRWLHVYGYFEYTDLYGVLRQTGFHYSFVPIDNVLIMERDPRLWFDRVVDHKKG